MKSDFWDRISRAHARDGKLLPPTVEEGERIIDRATQLEDAMRGLVEATLECRSERGDIRLYPTPHSTHDGTRRGKCPGIEAAMQAIRDLAGGR